MRINGKVGRRRRVITIGEDDYRERKRRRRRVMRRKGRNGEGVHRCKKAVEPDIYVRYDATAKANVRMTQYPSDIKLMFIQVAIWHIGRIRMTLSSVFEFSHTPVHWLSPRHIHWSSRCITNYASIGHPCSFVYLSILDHRDTLISPGSNCRNGNTFESSDT